MNEQQEAKWFEMVECTDEDSEELDLECVHIVQDQVPNTSYKEVIGGIFKDQKGYLFSDNINGGVERIKDWEQFKIEFGSMFTNI